MQSKFNMKIPAKYLSSYFPFSLQFYNKNNGDIFTLRNPYRSTLSQMIHKGETHIVTHEFVPILRPMKDLQKEEIYLEDGSKVFPIDILKSMITQASYPEKDIVNIKTENKTISVELENPRFPENERKEYFEIDTDPGGIQFSLVIEDPFDVFGDRFYQVGNEMEMLWKLFEWHFDVWGLIGEYAYDWNEIESNPQMETNY